MTPEEKAKQKPTITDATAKKIGAEVHKLTRHLQPADMKLVMGVVREERMIQFGMDPNYRDKKFDGLKGRLQSMKFRLDAVKGA